MGEMGSGDQGVCERRSFFMKMPQKYYFGGGDGGGSGWGVGSGWMPTKK